MTNISDQPHDCVLACEYDQTFKEHLTQTQEYQRAHQQAMALQIEYMAAREERGLNPTIAQRYKFARLEAQCKLLTGVMIYPWSRPVD